MLHIPRPILPACVCHDAGNGSQYSGMGRDLLAASPAFRASVQECADALKPYNIDLLAAYEEDGAWDDPILAAVGLASLQVGLCGVDLLVADQQHRQASGGYHGLSARECPGKDEHCRIQQGMW